MEPTKKPEIPSEQPGQTRPKELKVSIDEFIANFSANLNAADTGFGPEKTGKSDGYLCREEFAEMILAAQGNKLTDFQFEAMKKMKPGDKIKIDDLIKPFEKAMRDMDQAPKDGFIEPKELATAQAKKPARAPER